MALVVQALSDNQLAIVCAAEGCGTAAEALAAAVATAVRNLIRSLRGYSVACEKQSMYLHRHQQVTVEAVHPAQTCSGHEYSIGGGHPRQK